MAIEEHVALLKQGVSIWNKWRRNNPEVTPDLSDANLEGMHLEAANFEDVDFTGANLSRCNLRRTIFNGAALERTILHEADFAETIIENHRNTTNTIREYLNQIDTLISQLRKNDSLDDDDIINQLAKCIEGASSMRRSIVLNKLPEWVKSHELIFPLLNYRARINLLISQLKENKSSSDEKIINQLAECFQDTSFKKYETLVLNKLPEWVKSHELIFPLLNYRARINLLISQLKENKSSSDEKIINQLAECFQDTSFKKYETLVLNKLPEWVNLHGLIFPLLSYETQVELAYSSLKAGSLLVWQCLSASRKVLCVYKILAKSQDFSVIFSTLKKLKGEDRESNLLVRCTLNLLRAKDNPSQADAAFNRANDLIVEYVIDLARTSSQHINLYPLLPECSNKLVDYCEAKPWNETAWCVRGKNVCKLSNQNPRLPNDFIKVGDQTKLQGARLLSNCFQDWSRWTLLELLSATYVTPNIPQLTSTENRLKAGEYVAKLSAWINRINEIRNRLKCSNCSELMPHDIEYSKFSTKFRVTLFSCQHGDRHDQNIYLNECWGCGQIVDNRESRLKRENYYICIHCGSGPQHSAKYSQGDLCPNCGETSRMQTMGNGRLKCNSCNHLIQLPANIKLTGKTK